MNLLPKSHKEFSDKDYWNKFFKKRGNKAFEWYGEYLELCGQLHKYIKPKDTILITGCGNSSLSADLYDVGFTNITNIDVSEIVIRQMTSANAKRPNMKFLCMDALNMSFENDSFTVILDKGTLDALMPDNSTETTERIDKYFAEIKRVLKLGGRYLCISLLQSHILTKLLDTFCDKSWMFRVVRCHEAEQKNAENTDGNTLPVFLVVATKFKEMPKMILEVCMGGEKMVRVETPAQVQESVKSAQDAAFITSSLARTSLEGDDEVSLDLHKPGEDTARYTLYVVDQKQAQPLNKYAVFIVPQGRESEWLFGTPNGRRQLQDSARFGRLVVAVLRRGHTFDSLDAVKEELAEPAKMLIPNGFSGQIPFLSLGSDVGRRERVFSGTSKVSGDFVVEDVDVEGDTFRRLIFLDNQFLVQSEAKLVTVKKKNKTRQAVDFGHISMYQSFMSVGVQLAMEEGTDIALIGLGGGGLAMFLRAHLNESFMSFGEQLVMEGSTDIALIGLGSSGLTMFLRKCFTTATVTAVDIDPAMLEVAKNYFELTLDDQMRVRIEDGLDFLAGEAKKGSSYSAVMFDVDNKDRSLGLSCPPPNFLKDDVMANVKTLLGENGQFILNLVCRDNDLHASIMNTIRKHFKHIITVKIYDEVNEIVFATNSRKSYSLDSLEAAAKALNGVARETKLVKIKCVDLVDLLQSVKIVS